MLEDAVPTAIPETSVLLAAEEVNVQACQVQRESIMNDERIGGASQNLIANSVIPPVLPAGGTSL